MCDAVDYIAYSMSKPKTENKQNIRYLGFEIAVDGGRRFGFSITATGQSSTRVTLDVPALAFTGANRITYQESAKICYEKLRVLLENPASLLASPAPIPLTGDDIARFRQIPRGRPRPQA